ncbi:MAG: hypothetical protein U1E73_02680 [Planctomycetota bacterium]
MKVSAPASAGDDRSASAWAVVVRIAAAVAMIAYPVVVWLGLSGAAEGRSSARGIALLLLAVIAPAVFAGMRRSQRQAVRGLAAVPLVTVGALALAAALNASDCLLAVPVAINAVLLVAFGSTLRAGAMPMIERFACLQDPELSPAKQRWCRAWTFVWCLFFVLNGGAALGLAWLAPMQWWAVYNGLVAYVLIGALLALEWVLRRRRFATGARG